MVDEKFFLHPVHDWQKRYEALRASYVDRLPAKAVAQRFGYTENYIYLLRHQFQHGKIDFSEPVSEEKTRRRKVDASVREKICNWREHRLSAGEIVQLLSEEGIEISVRTVERVLAEAGYPKLPRRTRLKAGFTVKGTEVPETACIISVQAPRSMQFESQAAGVFLFAPFIEQLNICKIVSQAGLPGTKKIPAVNYLLSFLALKLVGTNRYAHVGEHAFDPGPGLFAGLNVLPKCTAMSTYSYSLDSTHIMQLQKAFVKQAERLGLYDKKIINLDFHTAPHFVEDSVLEEHWAGARNKTMKGALTLFTQDAASKLIFYTAADIRRKEADDQVLDFLGYWQHVYRSVKPTFVFDSKLTTYTNLAKLNARGVKFITLRRRGKKMLAEIDKLSPWKRIHVPHVKRKYPNPLVHDAIIPLDGYEGPLRQIVLRGNNHETPAVLITNDFESPVELIVGNYSRRWRVENAISEAIRFFSLNALSSPILVKIHFDVALTMVADTLYSMLARKLRGFEDCDAPKIYRSLVKGKAGIKIEEGELTVTYPRRAHNPILRNVPWHRLPGSVSWLDDIHLNLKFS